MNTQRPRLYPSLLACVSVLLCGAFASPQVSAGDALRPTEPVSLFNGRDLAGWVIVTREGDAATQETWSVRDGVLVATGSPFGYARTAQAYRDYALRVEWRWVPGDAPLDAQGKPRGRNSGVLLHTQGEDKVWPLCLEAQLQQGNAGDFIAMGTTVVFDELRALREKTAAAAPDEEARQRALSSRRLARLQEASEKPVGEWNVYEIVCRDSMVTLTVNGVLQNTATGLNLTAGTIGLQSEGMPVEFRRVELSPLK